MKIFITGFFSSIFRGKNSGKFEKVQYNGFNRREAIADWDECYNVIVKLIEEKGVVKSKDLGRQIVVFSYFFERATEAGIIGMTMTFLFSNYYKMNE